MLLLQDAYRLVSQDPRGERHKPQPSGKSGGRSSLSVSSSPSKSPACMLITRISEEASHCLPEGAWFPSGVVRYASPEACPPTSSSAARSGDAPRTAPLATEQVRWIPKSKQRGRFNALRLNLHTPAIVPQRSSLRTCRPWRRCRTLEDGSVVVLHGSKQLANNSCRSAGKCFQAPTELLVTS